MIQQEICDYRQAERGNRAIDRIGGCSAQPEAKPLLIPPDSVRRMQSSPMGPTGAAMEKPKISPFSKNGIAYSAPLLSGSTGVSLIVDRMTVVWF